MAEIFTYLGQFLGETAAAAGASSFERSKKTIQQNKGLRPWSRIVRKGLFYELIYLIISLTYIINTIDIHGNIRDKRMFDTANLCNPTGGKQLNQNAFTFRYSRYLNPETWLFWDLCFTQHKWYICDYENAKLDNDQFERACAKLFPCAGADNSNLNMSKTEIFTKVFRWPYLYKIVYNSFKNCFNSSNANFPNYFIFSKPFADMTEYDKLSNIIQKSAYYFLFLIQSSIWLIMLGGWLIYTLLYLIFSPLINISYLYVDFSAGIHYFGILGIFGIYLFLMISGIFTAFVTGLLIFVILIYHLLIHPFVRLFTMSPCSFSKLSRNMISIFNLIFYVTIAIILYATLIASPNNTFTMYVLTGIILFTIIKKYTNIF
jgi:hypothetical protein